MAKVTDPDPGVAWGFFEDDVFVPVPKIPLLLGGLAPPLLCQLYLGERLIVRDPAAKGMA